MNWSIKLNIYGGTEAYQMEQKYITTKAQSFQDNFEKYINKTSLWRMGESRYIGKMKENKFHFYYYPGYKCVGDSFIW